MSKTPATECDHDWVHQHHRCAWGFVVYVCSKCRTEIEEDDRP